VASCSLCRIRRSFLATLPEPAPAGLDRNLARVVHDDDLGERVAKVDRDADRSREPADSW
jgi:hypothetical protein